MTTPTMKEILRVTASDREDAMTAPTPGLCNFVKCITDDGQELPMMRCPNCQKPRMVGYRCDGCDLAAAQEANKRLEACVHGEVPEGALNALGRWLAPVLDEDKWATAEPLLNAALLQLMEAQDARQAAEEKYRLASDSVALWKERAQAAESKQTALEVTVRELTGSMERAQAAEERAGLLFRLIETVMAIPTMTDEQLAELQRNCRAAIAGEKK